MTAFDLALHLFRSLHRRDSRFYGTTLIDARLPMIETWDAERETNYVITCYASADQYQAACMDSWLRAEQGGEALYPCGVIPAVCGLDRKVHELSEDECAALAEMEQERLARRNADPL